MGFEPRTFSAGSPVKRKPPGMLCRIIAALIAKSAPSPAMPRPESVGMTARLIAQPRTGLALCAGSLAIARHRIIFGVKPDRTGPPLRQSAQKAVGIPAEPSSTVELQPASGRHTIPPSGIRARRFPRSQRLWPCSLTDQARDGRSRPRRRSGRGLGSLVGPLAESLIGGPMQRK